VPKAKVQMEPVQPPQYDIEEFLDDVMDRARQLVARLYPLHLHRSQLPHVWDRLIEEIEHERDGR
jgi:hypothetical protein